MTKDQEIASLQHKMTNLEGDLEKAEQKILDHKSAKDDEEAHKSVNDSLNRKIALLESELDNAEKQLRETTDKLSSLLSSSADAARAYAQPQWLTVLLTDLDKLMSRRNTLKDKSPALRLNVTDGKRSTRKLRRNTTPPRGSSRKCVVSFLIQS